MIDSDPVLHQLKDHEFHRELKKIVGAHVTAKQHLDDIARLGELDDDELDYRGDIELQCEEVLEIIFKVIGANQEPDIDDMMTDLRDHIKEIRELCQ